METPVNRSSVRDLALDLIKCYGYRRHDEPFMLASGQVSRDYIDCFAAFSTGERLRTVSIAMIQLAQRHGMTFTLVGGPTMGADSISMAIAMEGGCGWFSVRKQPKPRGRMQWIEGARLTVKDRVLLVDC